MRAGFVVMTLTLLGHLVVCRVADAKPKNDAAAQVFGLDKVLSVQLTIQPDQWEKMQPKRGRGFGFPPGRGGPPGPPTPPARPNPNAKARGGFGFEFAYVKGDMEIDGQKFKDVGVRYKGSGSYATARGRLKRPFKIDLNSYHTEQTFHGLKKLTLNNNGMDASASREVLSYGVYRSLDVPAARTAYVRLYLTVPGKYNKEFVGLYTLVETIDKTFLKTHFGSAKGLLLKPERVGPLEHLGDEWQAYEGRYRPKTAANARSKRRLIDFTKLVQKADDKTFRREIDKYLDVDEFLRFLACTTALVNMDSFIGVGHNFLLYLHPKTDQFVFLPWDLDLSMAAFGMMGSRDSMTDLSIRQPQTNHNRLIERLFADDKIYAAYKEHLRKLLEKGFTEEGIRKDAAAIKAAIEPIQKKEKEAVAARKENNGRPGFGGLFNRQPDDLPGFAAKRIASIKGQLDGSRKGKVLAGGFGRRGGFGPGRFLVRPILDAADKDKDGKLSKDEMNAAVTKLFAALDKEHKGQLTQQALTDGINKLIPGPRFGGRPPGPPGRLGEPPGAPRREAQQRPNPDPAPVPDKRAGNGSGNGKERTPPPQPPGPPTRPGGRPGFGFGPPGGLGGMFARTLIDKAGKDGKVNVQRLLALANKTFTEADKNKDGKLDDKELTEAVNKLMPPFGPPRRPPGPPGPPPGPPRPDERGPKREGR